MASLFGWELLHKCIDNDILKKDDVIVAFVHWFIVKNGFRCIGIGDSKELTGEENQTETLPTGWNQGTDFTIRYVFDNKLYLLRASRTDGDIIFNFLRSNDLVISSCMFALDDIVHGVHGSITTIMPGYEVVMAVLRQDLLDPVFIKPTPSVSTQTETKTTRAPTIPVSGLPAPPRRGIVPAYSPYNYLEDINSVGRSDLDPLHRGGGGMIFDPFSNPNVPDILGPVPGAPGGLPRGAVPPGARFDPFSPLGPGRRSGPDPDHMRPPGADDMFM